MLERAQALTDSLIVQLAGAPDSRIREHLFRILQERHDVPAKLIMTGFDDAVARVCRAAVMAASVHPDPAMFEALLDLLANASKQDSQLHYAARMALRNLLRDHEGVLRATELTESEILQIAGVCLSLKSRKAAQFLVSHLEVLSKVNTEQLNAWLQFAASKVESASLEKIATPCSTAFLWTVGDSVRLAPVDPPRLTRSRPRSASSDRSVGDSASHSFVRRFRGITIVGLAPHLRQTLGVVGQASLRRRSRPGAYVEQFPSG